ncbi:MAG: DNA polymerase III subunit epsilon [Rhodospirillales bacterium]|jgi:DNA polymerase-3 subunit epsilon|nr:DNA polymerase III subunit epsilon [Rhodospirillaceae bacterium]MDP6428334.1 DNA polymerase III subunit epsilon [Rhodospirillales bacterium]MDP6642579.1 DNA polymerase III subunit epsilon [Rhodospirillales bacterium]MDP6842336.1 DNA polymerase III subunit epsilon [Rhodospirillales bacterium]
MREIVLDTETTGLNPAAGDKIVEIGCIELDNHLPTGRTYHQYINPERPMPEETFAIHGLSDEFLAEQLVMADVAEAFLEFIGAAPLVIHNAEFDLRFINAELEALDRPPLPAKRAIDTVGLARSAFPGAPASLDALCKRFGIDNSSRALHGALLDAQLLAEVYLELIGGRQPDLKLKNDAAAAGTAAAAETARRAPRPHAPSQAELAAHDKFLEKIDKPVWRE